MMIRDAVAVLLLLLTGCTSRSQQISREMYWTEVEGGVRLTFARAPKYHIRFDSPKALAFFQSFGKRELIVQFEVRRPWWSQKIFGFDIVAIEGQRLPVLGGDSGVESIGAESGEPGPFSEWGPK